MTNAEKFYDAVMRLPIVAYQLFLILRELSAIRGLVAFHPYFGSSRNCRDSHQFRRRRHDHHNYDNSVIINRLLLKYHGPVVRDFLVSVAPESNARAAFVSRLSSLTHHNDSRYTGQVSNSISVTGFDQTMAQ